MVGPYIKSRIRLSVTLSLWIALLITSQTSPANALSVHKLGAINARIVPGSSRYFNTNHLGNGHVSRSNRLFRKRKNTFNGGLSPSRVDTCLSSSPMVSAVWNPRLMKEMQHVSFPSLVFFTLLNSRDGFNYQPHADLAVRLDKPVLSSPTHFSGAKNVFTKSILSVLLSDVFKTACVAFLIALFITFAAKSTQHISKLFSPITSSVKHCSKLARGTYKRFMDGFQQETQGVPMIFEGDGEDGWGVCTLSAVKPLGRSQYMEYEFKLPKADNVLQLALGQQLTLCCLDSADNVAKRNFYVYSPKNTKGQFSVITPPHIPEEDVEMKKRRARGEGDFVSKFKKNLLFVASKYLRFLESHFNSYASHVLKIL